MLAAIVLLPALAGILAFVFPARWLRRALLVGAPVGHLALSAWTFHASPEPLLQGWLDLDSAGQLFLLTTSVLFVAASLQTLGYLDTERAHRNSMATAGNLLLARPPEAIFAACLLLLLSALTLVTICQHFGLLWVAVEATTLASAPLIYFHRDGRSLEATWKYLVVCSVGIALALLGNFFLAVAASGNATPALVVSDLVAADPALQPSWLKAAMIFFVVGYGTKMGLAPLHTWLPDAHSEAPAAVSAVLSGAVLNCAFLAILRTLQVCGAAGLGAFAQELMLVLGFASMGTAAVFVLRQPDYKRMLAYSSVEHMGILAIGVGIGGSGAFGALLHAINHSLAKGMLFLAAGQILAIYATKRSARIHGLLGRYPLLGWVWIGGFMAISGVPPFGVFVSELTIAKAAIDSHRPVVLVLFLLLLAVVFIGMASSVLAMAQGQDVETPERIRGRWVSLLPAMALGALALGMGLAIPPFLQTNLQQAAAMLQPAASALRSRPAADVPALGLTVTDQPVPSPIAQGGR